MTMNRLPSPTARGFSLLEVLVTLVILAVGLLGAALLMSVSVRQQHQTRLHTQAVFVGETMMERMRANPIAVWNQTYDGDYTQETIEDTPDCADAPCNPTLLAARDGQQWIRELNEFLFGGTGTIDCVVNTLPDASTLVGAPPLDGYCDMTVAWMETSTDDANTTVEASVAWRFIP